LWSARSGGHSVTDCSATVLKHSQQSPLFHHNNYIRPSTEIVLSSNPNTIGFGNFGINNKKWRKMKRRKRHKQGELRHNRGER
jgi:hypothetical protein